MSQGDQLLNQCVSEKLVTSDISFKRNEGHIRYPLFPFDDDGEMCGNVNFRTIEEQLPLGYRNSVVQGQRTLHHNP
ncbi:hypothetical protein RRG08_012110 [Elysia crispata]|uniref:Uncharacterized protein n=1 Tax=Elysia crispata TaxID=231223 RepID=A0AAE1E5A1_9GAST|nr:hypothetical protein RRG08_012110 [Elysia crispata]